MSAIDIMNMLPPDMPGDDDVLILGPGTDNLQRSLIHWHRTTPELHEFTPDNHRLHLEHWIWEHREELADKSILDIGAQNPRRWLGEGYRTFGHTADVDQPDVLGDLLDFVRIPHPSTNLHGRIIAGTIDAIICTEVLEHCRNPFKAVEQMRLALAPGGLLLVTSPFLWPWHGTEDYSDFWRFSRQGWELLLKDFRDVEIRAVPWTAEAKGLLDLVRRFEGWGFRNFIEGHTGYLASARK